jgi:hypothetical protein
MNVYVIYPMLCVDIYVISLFVLMEGKKNISLSFLSARVMLLGKDFLKKIFSDCQGRGTRQIFLKK